MALFTRRKDNYRGQSAEFPGSDGPLLQHQRGVGVGQPPRHFGLLLGRRSGVPALRLQAPPLRWAREEKKRALPVMKQEQVPGATSARGVAEFVFNLNLARRIEQQLLAAGFRRSVLLITEGPSGKGLVERVKRAKWFVKEQHLWLVSERPRDCHALLLAA